MVSIFSGVLLVSAPNLAEPRSRASSDLGFLDALAQGFASCGLNVTSSRLRISFSVVPLWRHLFSAFFIVVLPCVVIGACIENCVVVAVLLRAGESENAN